MAVVGVATEGRWSFFFFGAGTEEDKRGKLVAGGWKWEGSRSKELKGSRTGSRG